MKSDMIAVIMNKGLFLNHGELQTLSTLLLSCSDTIVEEIAPVQEA